ncbi:hypothetical protein ACNKU7_01955 [Microbulbifer sp. SA54]|uniref:hypothetical protein n=1 Tax=Microbulbifer sp. SA54 TaxID=3401577 RepID=UPI003AAC9327
MTSTDIWIVFLKCRALPGCDIDFDDCDFYFCEAFVPSPSSADILNTLQEIVGNARNGLMDKKFELVDASKIIRFDQAQWEVIGDNGNDVAAHALEAASSQQTVFSVFRSEEVEDEVQYKHTIFNRD